jgi:hypothetical protein
MAKFSGKIGFGFEREVSRGVYDLEIVERRYFGEVERDIVERVAGQTVLGESKTGNSFNIVADGYARLNFWDMKYVFWNGRYWDIRQVELLQRPRMRVRIGGVYNGPTGPTTPTPDPPGEPSG